MRKKGLVPTEAEIKENAERTYRHFESSSVLRRLGIGPKGTFFYVSGFTPEGKFVAWGPMEGGLTEATALAKGLIESEVFEAGTRDLKKFKQELKSELMRRGVDPDKALRRMSSKDWEKKEH